MKGQVDYDYTFRRPGSTDMTGGGIGYAFLRARANTIEGGTHLVGFRSALTATVNRYARDKKLIKDKDPALTGDDTEIGRDVVIEPNVFFGPGVSVADGAHIRQVTGLANVPLLTTGAAAVAAAVAALPVQVRC